MFVCLARSTLVNISTFTRYTSQYYFETLFYLEKMHSGGYCLILYLLAFVFTVAYCSLFYFYFCIE